MATHRVRLFELPSTPTPRGALLPKPVEVAGFAIEAEGVDRAIAAVRERLKVYGYTKVRSVSCLADGGFGAVVHAKENAK